jgi:alkyl sulfatase BDS1-like metallo-beta-lactamase superfamily hydrolase
MAPAMTITQLFDSIAIRIDGPKAWHETLSINWVITDAGERYRMELSNGALVHFPTKRETTADLTVTLTRLQLLRLLGAGVNEGIDFAGDAGVLPRLLALTETPDPSFRVVTP